MSDLQDSMHLLFSKEKAVKALFFNGSRAIGVETNNSDYDFTILVRRRSDEVDVYRLLKAKFEALPPCHEVLQFDDRGRRLSVSIYRKSWLVARVASLYCSPTELLKWQGTLQHKVVEARAIIDPHDLLPRLQAVLADYPSALALEVSRNALDYLQTEYLDDWSFHSVYHYGYCLRDILEHIAIAFYALNRRLYMPPMKRFAHDLSSLQPNIGTEITELTHISEEPDWNHVRSVLAAIIIKLKSVVPLNS